MAPKKELKGSTKGVASKGTPKAKPAKDDLEDGAFKRDYCTLLDVIAQHKETRDLLDIILDREFCMSSLFTRNAPMVLIVPKNVKSVFLTPNIVKGYMLRGSLDKGTFQTHLLRPGGVYPDWLVRDIRYTDEKSIVVDNVTCHLFTKHIKSYIYFCDERLPEPHVSPKPVSGGSMYNNEMNGGENMGLVSTLFNSQIPRYELTNKLVRELQQSFPETHFNSNNPNCWSTRLFASFIVHGDRKIPNFRNSYYSLLGLNPRAAVELLLQHRVKSPDDFMTSTKSHSAIKALGYSTVTGGGLFDTFSTGISSLLGIVDNGYPIGELPEKTKFDVTPTGKYLSDDQLYDFVTSMADNMGDASHIGQAQNILMGYSKSILNNPLMLTQSPIYMNEMRKSMAKSILSMSDDKIAPEIVAVYRKVYGNLDEENPDQGKLYRRVYYDPAIVMLNEHLTNHTVNKMADHPEYNSIMNLFHSGSVATNAMNYLGSGSISGSISMMGGAVPDKYMVETLKGFVESVTFLQVVFDSLEMSRLNGLNIYNSEPVIIRPRIMSTFTLASAKESLKDSLTPTVGHILSL